MSFTEVIISESDILDDIVNKLIHSEEFENLLLYDINIKAYFTQSLRGSQVAEIKSATPTERLLGEYDAIIMVSEDQTGKYSRKDFEAVIAHLLKQATPTYRGISQNPIVDIRKNYYQVHPDIVLYYGKDLEMNRDLFDKIDNMDPSRPQYGEEERREGSFKRFK